MEDISRELEREIALTKPKPYKQVRKTKILIVDDFGKIKPGEYLKTLVRGLSVVSLVCFVAAGLLYYLYTGLSKDTTTVKSRLTTAEKKVVALTKEKEVLMARLVISGKEPGVENLGEIKVEEKVAGIEEKKPVVSKNQKIISIPSEPYDVNNNAKDLIASQEKQIIKPALNAIDEPAGEQAKPVQTKSIKKTVSIEKFSLTKDGTNGDLLVRFDIRNISKEPGDVSGRIFVILKPEDNNEDKWLVVPTSPLKNGIPSIHRKGQYFAIAHFKPTKFRIKNHGDPESFKKASVVIFNNQGDLIIEKLVDITEAQ